MNKSEELLDIVEKILNPEKGYTAVKNYYGDTDDSAHSHSTHQILSKEAETRLKNTDYDSQKAKALMDYASIGYKDHNNYLRNKREPEFSSVNEVKQKIRNLKSLTRHTTKHEFYTYRGINDPSHAEYKRGDLLKDKGFTSTSLKPATAKSFSRKDSDPESAHLFRIKIKPGTKGHYASGHDSIGDSEREFILHPGTTFRVGKKHKHPSGETYTDLHIHKQAL